MDNNDNYVPSVESLTPYQSAMDFFQGKLKDDDTLAFTFVIISPAESYAIMIERTLKSKAEYGITVTISPKRKTGTMEIESWRIHGVSKQLRFGDLSEEKHHEITGWIYDLSGYFNSDLQSLAYRL